MTLIKQIHHNSAEYQQMISLRDEMLRKPLKLTFSESDLEKEKNDILIGAFREDRLVGCCVLTHVDKETVKLRQMAVAKTLQKSGTGTDLLKYAEAVAKEKGYKTLRMHARETAVKFYQKSGYHISSEQFIEVTLPHYVMEKQL